MNNFITVADIVDFGIENSVQAATIVEKQIIKYLGHAYKAEANEESHQSSNGSNETDPRNFFLRQIFLNIWFPDVNCNFGPENNIERYEGIITFFLNLGFTCFSLRSLQFPD